jgi:thiamine biosynthesis lipoprotein
MRAARITRRNWLKLTGTAGLATLAPTLLFRPAYGLGAKKHHRVAKTLPLMNTTVEITVLDTSRQLALESIESGFAAMRETIPLFDRFDPNGRIARLNQSGSLDDLPPELATVLQRSKQLHAMSEGAFDITVLPLLESYQRALRRTGHPPSPESLRRTRQRTGLDRVVLHSGSVRMASGTRITLDGIAKGYVVDAAAKAIRRCGARAALINAGGDVRAVGDKNKAPWIVGIQDPQAPGTFYQKVGLSDLAIATSGSYANSFHDSARHNHLISSQSGISPKRCRSASVLAPSAVLADGLSTTFFLAGPEKGLRLCGKLREVEALILTKGNRPFASSGWRSLVV